MRQHLETSLHQQLKSLYATDSSKTEVGVKGFRIDAIGADGELIEIQHASLGALRDKTRKLLAPRSRFRLRIVKPIVRRKRVTTLCPRTGEVLRSRMSPKSCDWLDIFQDLVHFSTVFPHPRLVLEVLLVDTEETRVDRKHTRRRRKNYQSVDTRLVEVGQSVELRSHRDLMERLPLDLLPSPFDTGNLAQALERQRWFAQKVAYCLRQMEAIELAGKRGNSMLYKLTMKTKKPLSRSATSKLADSSKQTKKTA